MAWKTGIREIFTIYQKPTNNLEEMREMNVNWWDDWDIGDGTIGQRYGATVSRYDLINNLIKDIQNDPYGRRKIVSLWQETDLHETAGLAPRAFLTIWNVRNDERGKEYLDMCLIQRSGDMLTASGAGGINEIQYASLLMMIARHCGYEAGVFTHFVANEQIYSKHMDATNEMLCRWNQKYVNETLYYEKKENPNLILNPDKTNFYDFTIEDFTMINYEPMKPQLKLELGI
jgi:thymidylate synthase